MESVINELSLSRGGACEQALFIRQKGVPICANLHLSHSDSKFIKSFQQIRLSSPNTLSAKQLKVSLIYPNENLSPLASILVKNLLSCNSAEEGQEKSKEKAFPKEANKSTNRDGEERSCLCVLTLLRSSDQDGDPVRLCGVDTR